MDMCGKRRSRFAGNDRAASPVIGVILMVGTTVVLGASVYAWSAAYGNVPEQAVKVLALMQTSPPEEGVHALTVLAAMPGLRYGDLLARLDGEALRAVQEGPCAPPADGAYAACDGARVLKERDVVHAGDSLLVRAPSGSRLEIMDVASGAVVWMGTLDAP